MKVLLIHNNFGMGGIETQLLQYLPVMVKNGVDVEILAVSGFSSPEILSEVSNHACVTVLRIWERLPLFQTIRLDDKYDVIFCTGWRAYIHGLRLKKRLHLSAKVCLGVYHPREFNFSNEGGRYQSQLFKLLGNMPDCNVFFHHDDYKHELEKELHRKFNPVSLVPFAINVNWKNFLERSPVRYKIVTIGRIVDFKQYHFAMVDVISSLRSEGYPVDYHIYGYGKLEDSLVLYIKEKGMEGIIEFHGAISYRELPLIFKSTFAFIGMGVAVVDACAAGVPSLVAIESNRLPETYGFYCEQDDFNTGSIDLRKKRFSIAEKLKELLNLDDKYYDERCVSSRKAIEANDAEVIGKKFCEDLKKAKQFDLQALGLSFFVLDMLVSLLWTLLDKMKINTPAASRYWKNEGE